MASKIKVAELAMDLKCLVDLQGFKAGDKAIESTLAKIKRLAIAEQEAALDARKLGEQMGMLDPNSRKLKELGGLVKSVGGRLGTFSNMVIGGLVVAGTAAAYTLAHWSEETFKLGHHLDDVHQRTGLSTDSIQEWRYAAKLGGADGELFEKATLKLAKGLDSLAKGKGPAVEAMQAFGISLQDPAIKSKNLEQILYLVANAASKMPDGAEKAAAFMKLFGKSGAELIPMFNEGVLGVKGFAGELRKLGGVMSGESISALAATDDQVDKLKTAFEGLKNKAVIALLPHISDLADRMLKWVEANQDMINQKVPEIMDRIWQVATKIGDAIAFAADHWQLLAGIVGTMTVLGAVNNVATAVGGIVSAVKIAQAGFGAMSAAGSAGMLAMLGPLAAVAAALGSIWYFQHKMGAHDMRDTIEGKKSEDVSWDEASQLRVARESAPDVDAITIAQPLTEAQLIERDKKLHPEWYAPPSAETVAAMENIRKNSFGAKLNGFLSPQLPNMGLQSVGAPIVPDGGSSRAPTVNPIDLASGATGPMAAAMNALTIANQSTANGVQLTNNTMPDPQSAITVPMHGPYERNAPPQIMYSPNYSIKIDASGMTPDQLKTTIDETLKEHDERSRREAAAALGVGSSY